MKRRREKKSSSSVLGVGRGRLRFSLLCSLLFLLGSALCSEEVKKPLPKPDRENRRVFSFSASLSDAQEVQLLRSRYGRGLYVETAVSIPLGIVMNWGAEEGEGGLEAFQRSVDNLFSQAKAQGVGLHLYFLTGVSRALSGLRGAKVEDLRNCQWFNDNLLLAPSAWQRVGDEFRPLPVGSRLDSERGLFTWLPGPGFLGEYRLEFLSSQGELFQVVVEVSPERNEKEEVVCP